MIHAYYSIIVWNNPELSITVLFFMTRKTYFAFRTDVDCCFVCLYNQILSHNHHSFLLIFSQNAVAVISKVVSQKIGTGSRMFNVDTVESHKMLGSGNPGIRWKRKRSSFVKVINKK